MSKEEDIVAIVTLNKDSVFGGKPIFVANSKEEQEKLALYISKATKSMSHDLENGTYILVRH